jgi:type VI protein secretion system component VasK
VASPPIPVNPQFVTAFSSLVRFSKALYGENGTEPSYKYSLKPKSEFYDSYTISVNGDKSTVKAGSASKTYTWPGSSSPSFSLDIVQKGNTNGVTVQSFNELWSVFRFFANAEKNDGTNFTFFNRSGRDLQPAKIDGKVASYDFSLDTQGAPAVFSKDFLGSLNCIGKVTATK